MVTQSCALCFQNFQNGRQYKNKKKIVENSKMKRFQDPLFGVNLTFFAPWLPWQRSPF
jgi:hypothetical protein